MHQTVERAINVAEPLLGPDEKAALAEVIDSGWITMGSRVRAFEKAFARMHGAPDSVAVASCTAGLHLIMLGLNLKPGDEVLVPSMTFVATVNCVMYVGATPIFVDIESTASPLMSLEDAATKCTDRTKAVIIVHYAGYMADREGWRAFAAERGLALVEDAAHAAGHPAAGTYGVAASFSFYGNKNMTTAEGGAVLTSDERLLDRIRSMRGHGMTSDTFERLHSRTPTYDVTSLGYNYRLDELRAAVGLVQLKSLPAWNEKRRHLTSQYRSWVEECCPEVQMPFSEHHQSAYHILPVVLPSDVDRQDIVDQLRAKGIQTSVHYPPAHRFSLYRNTFPDVKLPNTENFADRELTLPLHPNVQEKDVERIVLALSASLKR